MNEDKYNKTFIVQIEKEIEDRKSSERILRIDRSVTNESDSNTNDYNNSNTDIETKNVTYQRGREYPERKITNISLINKIERDKIGRLLYNSSDSV